MIRESDQWNLELFNAMRENTYLSYRDIPEVDAIRRVGLAPFRQDSFEVEVRHDDGSVTVHNVLVEWRRKGSTRVAVFFFSGSWHLWSQASAAAVGGSGVNDFTSILIDVICEIKPKQLIAANFSRLIRSQAQGAWLQTHLHGNVDVVRAGNIDFPFDAQGTSVGAMMFSMFSLVASMERDWIVTRLLAGRIAKWRRGEWWFGESTIPFGYRLDRKTKALHPDLSKRQQVREMLLILSRTGVPPGQMVKELDRAGVISMRKNREHDEFVPVGRQANPSSVLSSLYAWAPLWIEGEYLFRIKNVFPGLQELAGVPVVRHDDDDDDPGELQMLYRVGVPGGGWAEPAVMQAFANAAADNTRFLLEEGGRNPQRPVADAVAKLSANASLHESVLNSTYSRSTDNESQRRKFASRARARISALTGRTWEDGSWSYELMMSTSDEYKIVRRPIRTASAPSEVVGLDLVSQLVGHDGGKADSDDLGWVAR